MTAATLPLPGPSRLRGQLITRALVIATVLALAVPVLALRSAHSGAHAAAAGAVTVAGGLLSVERVAPEVMQHPEGMPAGMMPDPVPAGFQRVAVDVRFAAEGAAGLAYDGSLFRVTASGADETAPVRDGLGAGVAPSGATVTGTLTFQVSADATELEVGYPDAAHPVHLHLEPAAAHASH